MTQIPKTQIPKTQIHWAIRDKGVLSDRAVERAVEAALEHGRRAGAELSIVFVDDATLRGLHGRVTDVISFDLGEEGGGPAGEVYVSVERAHMVAERRGVSVERELTLYVVHGVLHLCGFDDRKKRDREQMRAAEGRVLASLGFPADLAPHDL